MYAKSICKAPVSRLAISAWWPACLVVFLSLGTFAGTSLAYTGAEGTWDGTWVRGDAAGITFDWTLKRDGSMTGCWKKSLEPFRLSGTVTACVSGTYSYNPKGGGLSIQADGWKRKVQGYDIYIETSIHGTVSGNSASGNSSTSYKIYQYGRLVDSDTDTGTWQATRPSSVVIIYVDDDASPGGDGTSWATAYKYLQDALYKPPTSGDQIWVAQGTYKPDQGGGQTPHDRTATFQLINGVAIYGGFDATETALAQRDVQNNETILSGDIGMPGDNTDNSYHVVTGSGTNNTAILDGFTVTAGNANASAMPHDAGGGMRNESGNPTVRNCTFTGNSAVWGGGIENFDASPVIANCTFSENFAGNGGGVNNFNSNMLLTNCTFSGNSATRGGGMYNRVSSSPTMTNCTFSGNSAAIHGGGMYNIANSSPTMTNCTFSGNTADSYGGGMLNAENSSPILINCTFSENSADDGGGMFNDSSNPTVKGCTFTGNSADSVGGGMAIFDGSPAVTNCTFSGNTANVHGGGMWNSISSPTVTNCTFNGNSAYRGGAMYNEASSSSPTVSNCILWGNTASIAGNEIRNNSSTPVISYCDIAACLPGGSWDTSLGTDAGGNIDDDPLFVDADGADNTPGTEDDNLRLPAHSPCIDAGDNTAVTEATDLDGRPRIVDGDGNGTPTVDMGAYEYEPVVIYVDAAAPGGGNGGSWSNAFADLQEALDAAAGDPDQIWVAAGIYYPTMEVDGIGDRYRTFQMINAVAIYGGFDATETALAQRDVQNNVTILSGDIGTVSDNSDNCYHVFYHPSGTNLDTTAILDGFTITAGNADGSADHRSGGGMYNYYSSPTVSNCTFTGNSARYSGGGMYSYYSGSPTVSNCTFTGNSANSNGGGINNYNSNMLLTNCIFTGNSANSGGGGMYNWSSSPTVTNCTFTGNSATFGGGMENYYGRATVTNCSFSANNSANDGGGMYNKNCNPTVTSCTFTGNSADRRDGGGMYNQFSSPTVTNCILWGNTASNNGNQIYSGTSTTVISYCDIAGCLPSGSWDTSLGSDGGGNIDADPLFVDAAAGDFHLQETSPCINAGDNSAPSLPATDFEGDPRIIYAIVDMGVDEVAGNVLFSLNVTIQPFPRACTVTLDPAGGVYLPGTEVTITIDAEQAYTFHQWSGDLTGNDSQATITMDDSHKYVTAHLAFNGDIIYVNADATGSNDGTSWANALTDLQDALAAAVSAEDIWVAAGTYYPAAEVGSTGDRYRTFQMINGVAIYGGFAGTETALAQRDVQNNLTILSGDIGTTDDPNDNCYHVFYHPNGVNLDTTAILDGFTITAGNADGSDPYFSGAGMYNLGCSPTVTNCTFSGNSADWGGGMLNDTSSPTVTGCTFIGNSAVIVGGGMYNAESSPTVTGCTFSGNSANSGAGMYNYTASPTVSNCTFIGNSAGEFGGGMLNDTSSPTVSNCTFTGNSAYHGGGMYNYTVSPTVTNCTFAGNSAYHGGGMYNYTASPTVTGCILWGNTAASAGNEIFNNTSTPVISYCDITGSLYTGSWDTSLGSNGGGNIDDDPLFVDADGTDNTVGTEDDNLRLSSRSPCIDAADNAAVPGGVTTDLDGHRRFIDHCYTNDTGNGTPPIVDMGAYEFLRSDINRNGPVDFADFSMFGVHWLETDCGECAGADLTCDGQVGWADLLELATNWLAGMP